MATIAVTLVGLGVEIRNWNRTEVLRSAIHQSSTNLWVGRTQCVQSHEPDVREEC